MKFSIFRPVLRPAVVAYISTAVFAQANVKPNGTEGYGEGKLLTFTYMQQYNCVEQTYDDLNFNGIPGDSDPVELQIPICQVGFQPKINPPGKLRTCWLPPSPCSCSFPCSPWTTIRILTTPFPLITSLGNDDAAWRLATL